MPKQQIHVPRASPTWYKMQVCVVHRGTKNVGREPSWRRSNPEHHKLRAPFFIQVNSVRLVVTLLVEVSSWRENPTDKNGLLVKHQLCPSLPVRG